MDEKLIRFFKKIGFTDLYPFEDTKLKNVIVKEKDKTWTINLISEDIIPVNTLLNLKSTCIDGIENVKHIYINIEYINKSSDLVLEYFLYYLDKIIKNNISLSGIDKDKISIDDDIILIEVTSKIEETILKKEEKNIFKFLADNGIKGYEISYILNEKEQDLIKRQIEKEKANARVPIITPKEDDEQKKFIPKKKIDYQREGIVTIESLIKEENAVNLEAYIFDIEPSILKRKDGKEVYLITIKISDNSSSILGKYFASDEEEYEKLCKELKKDNWYHFTGQVRMDNFAKDLVYNFRTYEKIDNPIIRRKDDSEKKRVELHAHTMMSQMDGVIDEVALVNKAIEFGHSGVAITDHDGCQAFPHVFNTVSKYNKDKLKEFDSLIESNKKKIEELKELENDEGIKELEKYIKQLEKDKKNYKPFKALYGVELDMCESNLNVVFNPTKEKLDGLTYVVFDTETTGFNPGLGDSMIEIGGVKVKDGLVIDRFDELINPGHHIDEAITRVTDISDDDVRDADTEENVVKRFKEWIEDLPLVAHNARFDKNILDMAYFNAGLGKVKNPIIDTLNLSRVINRDLKRHSLAALGKAYGIDTGEVDDEETNDNNASSNNEIAPEIGILLEDIKVDNESILIKEKIDSQKIDIATEDVIRIKEYKYYLKTIYKKSKTDKALLDVLLTDSSVISLYDKDISLHPAENNINIKLKNGLTEYDISITIYVGQHHGADVDSENTVLVFNRMLKQIEGIKTIDELNDLGKLEYYSFMNDPKKKANIYDYVSYHNYVRKLNEDETISDKNNPFKEYDIDCYTWKYEWCKDNNLQMYENIPGKTYTEHLSTMYDLTKHITIIAKNINGLKNLFTLVSFANTNFLDRVPRIPRRLIEEYRSDLLIGSACLNGEIFDIAKTRTDEELVSHIKFYDYIEVQPLENYQHLVKSHDINNQEHLEKLIRKIIRCAKLADVLVVATGDVHNLNKEDLISREIIVNQNVPGKGRHALARYLSGDYKRNENRENLEKAIDKAKRNGSPLNYVDLKVLKYIFALSALKSIPITSKNITDIYQLDKKNKNNLDEASLRGKDEDKRYGIDSSLRRLQIGGLITVNYTTGEYSLTCDFKKTTPSKGGHIPNQYFRTTTEMLDAFSFLEDSELINEIVIDNTNKILDMVDEIKVVDYPDKPYSPIIDNSKEDVVKLVYDKAHSIYGNPLPRILEERIAQEFYGDSILDLVKEYIQDTNPDMKKSDRDEIFLTTLHECIVTGYDKIVELMVNHMKKDESIDLKGKRLEDAAKDSLGGIIGGGFDVIYLIAQKLVKHSNDRGYLVGSRGSVGSSIVAYLMGITECNALPPHYYCKSCQYSEFDDEGRPYSYIDENGEEALYLSGVDLPDRKCPNCGDDLVRQGNDMPFATFLGFNADKVPDIDLNFSGDDQASAHDYTKTLFGTDNVYRAGTIGTVADKTAYGYVQGYFEERMFDELKIECKSYGLDVTSKDDLKKKGLIKSNVRTAEVERLAKGCTGVKRTTGQHPGGIVVVPGYKSIWDFTPFQYPADDPTSVWRTTHFDYHAIDADLLKLDILGHDDPTVLRMLQDLSGIDVTEIDLSDKETMRIFEGPEVLGVEKNQLRGLTTKDGYKYCPTGTLGVPEFGTSFLLGMLEETKPTTFAELIKISGLSHGTDVWLGNAQELIHKNVVPFSKVIGCRDDIMVNLMAWGVPAAKAFKIMEFVRKGKPSKEKTEWKKHKETLRKYEIPEYYIESCEKIKYMFPKAHATAYVTSAFRIAWFKVHHPIWYYCAYLSIRRDQFDIPSMILGENAIRDRIDEIDAKGSDATNKELDIRETLLLCLEMTLRGFYFHNIDIEKSDSKYFKITDDGKGLIIPFRAVDGLGDAVADSIIKAREKAPFISQEDLQKRGKCPISSLEKLKELGCLDNLSESNQLSLF